MKIKSLMFLAGALGAAALLKDKTRRDRLIGSAHNALDNARTKLDSARERLQPHQETPPANGTRAEASTFGAGATSRTYPTPGTRGSF
jgi:hypothetical protein